MHSGDNMLESEDLDVDHMESKRCYKEEEWFWHGEIDAREGR
jgi:hypothetical protein